MASLSTPSSGSDRSLSAVPCVVTGGTSGIGKAVALELARRGAPITLVARDRVKAEFTRSEIVASTGNDAVTYAIADLSLMGDVRRLAGELATTGPRPKVLINNAGAIYARRELTPEGRERTWALNVLAPFLLTRLMTDGLRRAPPARVINVASEAHRGARYRVNDPEFDRGYRAFRAYQHSKLALILWTYEFARRLPDRRMTINALHPGFVDTAFGRNNPGLFGYGLAVTEFLFAIRPPRGARTAVHLATSPAVVGVSGAYFRRCRRARSSEASYDVDAARRLWTRCEEQTGLPPFSIGN